MPKCGACGKYYDNPSQIELVRNQDDRWILVCRDCLRRGVDTDFLQNDNIALEGHAASIENEKNSAIVATLSPDPIENVKRLLAALKEFHHKNERMGRVRSHERKKVALTVYYTMARDDARYEARIIDFSNSGIRFTTSRPVHKGQILQFDWNIPLPPSMARVLQNTGEIRRSIRLENGDFEVGVMFMARQPDKGGANRRRFRRYKCDMLAYYQPRDSEMMSLARVTDLSQGGCQMRLDKKLEKNDVILARMIDGGGSRGDLVGTLQVCRVIPRDMVFETGCAFERMRMERQPGRAKGGK
ncbi:MAG: PilZ domain-containing protein [Planctomycetota bacterium]|jgi:hypothetical protein|nr:PilZ domain-containing protein [Planctomycetota bacterium]